MKENAFLDKIGLSHLIDKLKSLFAYKNHSHSPLNFTGATYESYDGSRSKSIHIPSYSVMQGQLNLTAVLQGLYLHLKRENKIYS